MTGVSPHSFVACGHLTLTLMDYVCELIGKAESSWEAWNMVLDKRTSVVASLGTLEVCLITKLISTFSRRNSS